MAGGDGHTSGIRIAYIDARAHVYGFRSPLNAGISRRRRFRSLEHQQLLKMTRSAVVGSWHSFSAYAKAP